MSKGNFRWSCTVHCSSLPVLSRSKLIRCYSTSVRQLRTIFEEKSKIDNSALDNWYQIDFNSLDNISKIVKQQFNGSPYKALSTIFPEKEWHAWKFEHDKVPLGFWNDAANHRKFFEDLAKKLAIQHPDDWYEKYSANILIENGGQGLLHKHNNSSLAALMAAYPEHNWIPWKFNMVPMGFWTRIDNQRKFFDDLGKKLGVQTLDNWYQKLSLQAVVEHGGSGMLRFHNRSPVVALMAVYPEHNWIPWNFKSVPQGFWASADNRRKFFDDLASKIGVQTLDDWYRKVSRKIILENGGAGLIENYNGSPTAALMKIYPEHNWIPWKFASVPHGYWNNKTHQKNFFDDLGIKLGVKNLDDWYEKLSHKAIVEHGGQGLLRKQSCAGALMAAYPEHDWTPWKFNVVENGYWNSKENVSKFVAELSERLSIQSLDDWYLVDSVQLKNLGASRILFKYRGMFGLLKEVYPHHSWDIRRFQQKGKKAQRWLAVTLKKMFPDEEILEDYNHPKVMLPSSNRSMQLDVFIPSKNLAFEYQGQQHYEDVSVFSPTKTYQQRDEEKRTLCASNNIKLIEVPYWWNRTQQSLQEMINK